MIELRLLPLPCPLNQLYRSMPMTIGRMGFGSGQRVISKPVLSKRARLRRDQIVAAIWQQLGGRPQPIDGPVQVSYTITPRDRRTPDVDAFEKQLLDCLQRAGVVTNDRQIVQVSKERLGPRHPGHLDVQVWGVP